MNGPFTPYIAKYLEHLELVEGLSLHTRKAYLCDINLWNKIFLQNKIQLPSMTANDIRQSLLQLSSRSTRSKQRMLASLRSFIDFALAIAVIESKSTLIVPTPKTRPLLPNILNEEEAIQLLDSLENLDSLILETLYCTGLRVSELVNLAWHDFSPSSCTLRVLGKGKKTRIVPVIDTLIPTLCEHKQSSKYNKPTDYIFCNKRGAPYSVRTIQRIVKKYRSQLSSNTHMTPHTFRHSYATHLLINGSNLKEIQELLGHSSLSTTQKYTQLDYKTMSKEYDRTHPLNKKK